MTTLFKQDAKGNIRVWHIEEEMMGFTVCHGQYGGTETVKHHPVYKGKSNRTVGEQVELEVSSRIKKKIDQGYSEDMGDAKKKATNALGLLKPMLAQTLENSPLPSEYYLQRKYDGNRCIITKQNGKIIAYSRSGQPIESIEHIKESADAIPEGTYLDGELYDHGTSLQQLRSWIARDQPESQRIKFIVYDLISPETFSNRFERLLNLPLAHPIIRAGTTHIDSEAAKEIDIISRLNETIANGYEGLIARVDDRGYEDGKRSKSLIKIKRWLDDEFNISDITPSADGWAILHCRTSFGRVFKVTAPGTAEHKIMIYMNAEKYIGRKVTVQYANLTRDGIPFHPVATLIH